MTFIRENIYHIYNRGNNRQKIFFEEKNYHFFLKKMRTHLLPHCHLLAWCLMPNHFHWMVQVREDYQVITKKGLSKEDENSPLVQPLNKSISTLLSSYTKAIKNMYDRTGSLFQRRTQSKNLSPSLHSDENYPLICFLYIHQNPIRAKLVDEYPDWPYSSYKDYAGYRNGTLCNRTLANNLLELPENESEFIQLSQQTLSDRFIDEIF